MSKYTVSKIKLNATKEVEEFVSAAGKCDFDIDIFYNRMIIDAKSILGILSMDLNNVLTVHCYGEDPEFSNTLRKFAVARAARQKKFPCINENDVEADVGTRQRARRVWLCSFFYGRISDDAYMR